MSSKSDRARMRLTTLCCRLYNSRNALINFVGATKFKFVSIRDHIASSCITCLVDIETQLSPYEIST